MNITPAITKDYEYETAFSLRENKPNFIRHSLVAFVAASAKKAGEGGQTQFQRQKNADAFDD